MKPLELYLHIPFCVQKCKYCDFLSAPASMQERQDYVWSLCQKIRSYRELAKAYHVISIFIGGGTPSLLESSQMTDIVKALQETFFLDGDMEFTVEANPGTLTMEKLHTYRSLGVNRLSLGLQSAKDEELKCLGRIHSFADFLESYQMARRAGFANINVDLMSGIPGQTPPGWEETLRKTAELGPEHISAYGLIIEEGTPFYDWYGPQDAASEKRQMEKRKPLPSEEEDRLMYERTGEYLAKGGYGRYEISNYALPGFACRHNLAYWERTDYAGFGLGAASLRENVRWSNTAELAEYLAHAGQTGEETRIKKEMTRLSIQDQMEEFMFLGLRKTEGVSASTFERLYGKPLEAVYEEPVERLIREWLLLRYQKEDGSVFFRLSDKGIDVSNYALAMFLF